VLSAKETSLKNAKDNLCCLQEESSAKSACPCGVDACGGHCCTICFQFQEAPVISSCCKQATCRGCAGRSNYICTICHCAYDQRSSVALGSRLPEDPSLAVKNVSSSSASAYVRPPSSSQSEPESIVAKDFGPASVNKVVNDILHRIQDSLLATKDPDKRLQLIVQGFQEHADVQRVRDTLGQDLWGLTKKAMRARDGVFQRLAAAIHQLKSKRDLDSQRLYRVLLEICAPEPGSGLMRETQRQIGLVSRGALTAASVRTSNYHAQVVLSQRSNSRAIFFPCRNLYSSIFCVVLRWRGRVGNVMSSISFPK
jgi:hypothetical protein